VAEWYEGFFNGLYAKVLPKTFDDSQTLTQARIVKRLLGVRKGARVLDIPCGMGRLTVPLARMGLVMTGVDLTASYIGRAQQLARREGLDITFIQSDMRRIEFDGEFDATFNWFTSIGYFCDKDNLAFCRRAFRALKPGGRFLVETMNKSWILSHFRPHQEHRIAGVKINNRNQYNVRTRRIITTWTLCKGRRVERLRGSIRAYNGAEMRALLSAAGFRDIKLYGHNWDQPPGRFSRHSRRMIAVGTRPEA